METQVPLRRPSQTLAEEEARVARVAAAAKELLEALGEDTTRQGLLKTPQRMAKALLFLTSGGEQTAQELIGDAVFDVESDEMVVVREIPFYSMCEHHMLCVRAAGGDGGGEGSWALDVQHSQREGGEGESRTAQEAHTDRHTDPFRARQRASPARCRRIVRGLEG